MFEIDPIARVVRGVRLNTSSAVMADVATCRMTGVFELTTKRRAPVIRPTRARARPVSSLFLIHTGNHSE